MSGPEVNRRSWIVALVVVLLASVAGWCAFRSSDEDSAESAEAAESGGDAKDPRSPGASGGDEDRTPARVAGRVVRLDDGSAVAGAVVLLARRASFTDPPITVRTDAGGGFELEDVAPGRYGISASAPGFVPAHLENVEVPAGGDVTALKLEIAAGGHKVTGTIHDRMGGTIEGAVVKSLRMDEGNALSFVSRAPSGTLADADGAYELWLPDGKYSLTAEHPDYVRATATLTVDGGPRNRDLTLTPGAVIEGRVVTRDGEAVPGAYVTWVGSDHQVAGGNAMGMNTGGAMGMGGTRVVADDAGNFRIGGLEPGVSSLSAVAKGWSTPQPVPIALGVAEELTGVELVVDKALTISGVVVTDDEAESPLSGVVLGAWSIAPQAAFGASAPSAADGTFEILGVRPGSYFVTALSDEVLPSLMGHSVQLEDEDVTDMKVKLGRGVHVRGRVEPPTPATITLEVDMSSVGMATMMSTLANGFVRGRADAEGEFDLFPVAGSKVFVVATADDGRKGRVELEVGKDDVDDVVVPIEERARLAGRVVDAHGDPVEGVEVTLSPTAMSPGQMAMSFSGGGMPGTGGGSGTTDEEGRFTVLALDGGAYKVRVAPSTGVAGMNPALAWADPADPEDPTAAIEVTLAEGERREDYELRVEARDGVITGTVVDADGVPQADAWVRVVREQSSDQFFAEMMDRFARFSGEQKKAKAKKKPPTEEESKARRSMSMAFAEPPVLTDAAGTFRVDDLRDGTYRVVADGPRGTGRAQIDGVVLGSDVELQVEPLGAIEGVVEMAGRKLGRFAVTVSGPDSRSQQVMDEAGRFTIDRLDPGTYEVRVEAEGGIAQTDVELQSGETVKVELEVEGFGTLRGKLVDGSGKALAGMNVIVQGRSMSTASMMGMFGGGGPKTDGSGEFELDKIHPGKGTVTFMDPDGEGFSSVGSASYEIEAEEDLDLGTITGVKSGKVPVAERGELGLSTQVATFAERPLPPDAPDEGEGDSDDGNPGKRLWVRAVTVDGPAEAAGVEPGDEIVSVRGVGVAGKGANAASLTLGPSHVQAGEDVSLEIKRGGMTRRVTIVARPRGSG